MHIVKPFVACFFNIQESVGIGEDGQEETILMLEPGCSIGEIAIICNIPQPYSVRVCELCRLLRLDKQSFTNILEIYFIDGRKVLSNLTEVHKKTYKIIMIVVTSPNCTTEGYHFFSWCASSNCRIMNTVGVSNY
jgi:hypothetical protein